MAFNIAFTELPLQISKLVGIERITFGWIWTLKVSIGPVQPAGEEIAFTEYKTLTGTGGFVKFSKTSVIEVDVWFVIDSPLTLLFDVALQLKFDGILDPKTVAKLWLLQMSISLITFTIGKGLIVILYVESSPSHEYPWYEYIGFIVIILVIGVENRFTPIKLFTLFKPLEPKPIEIFELVQE